MQPSSREMQSSSGQINIPEIQNAGGMQVPAAHFDNSAAAAAAAHDDFFDQMLSTLPSTWPDLGNPKSPWDLASPNSGGSAADVSNVQKLFSLALAGKSPEETDASAENGNLHYAPYDESSLLASRLRQHQISGGDGSSPAGKPMLLQLNHHHHSAQQQQMLLPAMGRLGGGNDPGLLPLPLCLASGGSAESRLLGSREDVDASFKSPNSTGGEGLYNGFGGSLQRGASQTAGQHHFQQPQGGSTPAQSYSGPPAAAPGGGGTAPPRQRVRARRGQATDPHSIAERLRRERIAERMKALQELVPNANKTDKASMLDEIIDYVKFLQLQVKVLSMSRLGGAAAVAPLVADVSSEAGRGGGGNAAAGSDSLAVAEHQVAKLMEEDMGTAMQYLQGKGLCLMPISLASAISTASCHPRGGGGGGIFGGNAGLIPTPPGGGGGDGPSSPSMSVLTVQSAMANGGDSSAAKDAASVSKP